MLVIVLAAVACAGGPARAQDLEAQQRRVGVGGGERMYLLHVPPELVRPAAVVMVFHGGGGRAQGIMKTTRMNDIADHQHFIVVYPEGVGGGGFFGGGSWNVGPGWGRSSADDVGFVRAILADLGRNFPIDRRRIYATGESMGGIFSYRLACEMSGTFAAIAPVAATMVERNCTPHNPVAVFHVHGSADENIPLNGGAGRLTASGNSWPPPGRGVQFWAEADHCAPTTSTTPDGPETICYRHNACGGRVELCLVNGGGHGWPGSEPHFWQQRFGVHVSQTFPASVRIWTFFAAHPKS